MSYENIIPSSMDGIKRLAKSIKARQNIKHTQALNSAAVIAGFQNFNHAFNNFEKLGKNQNKHYGIFLTTYWHDKESNKRGRETLTIWLESNWNELVTPYQMQANRGLSDFRSEGPDHLAYRYTTTSQISARNRVCAAARNLQFMDATKLRPSRNIRVYPKNNPINSVPHHDHSSIWCDVKTKRYLFVDEPYSRTLEDKERAAWALKFGQRIELSTWPGMYYPGGSDLFLISDLEKGIPLDPIIAALEKLPNPITEETWSGESAPNIPIFVSPGAIENASKKETKKLNTQPQAYGQRNTVSYIMTLVGPQRRPKGKIPIDVHQKIGRMLTNILASSYYRNGVYNRVDAVRSELDEWVQREYTSSELSNDIFFDLYYHDFKTNFARKLNPADREKCINDINEIKQILSNQYPQCSPLRKMLKKLDLALGSMNKWES